MLDLHCHLLPGVDDGPADLDESVAVARCLVNAGFTAAAPSPHFGIGPGGDVPVATAARGREVVRVRLAEEGIALELMQNAEHYVTPELFARLAEKNVAPINRGQWLLVEIPWGGLADPESVLFRIQTKGYHLLLAHPERLPELSFDLLARLVQRGIKMQLNLASFANIYGSQIHLRALELTERGLVHVLATDLHHALDSEIWIHQGMRAIADRYGKRAIEIGAKLNPRAIAANAVPDKLSAIAVPR